MPNSFAVKRKATNGIHESDKDLNHEFLCPVCFEILEEAHVTKCGHTFCFKCITESLVGSNRCPQCNFVVDQYFPNFLLNEMISKYKKIKLKEKLQSKVNNFQKTSELQKMLLDKYEELNMVEINQIIILLNAKKSRIEEDMKMKQNELLKEFIERVRKHKTDQFEQLQRELTQIEDDYKTLLQIIENEKVSAVESGETIVKNDSSANELTSKENEISITNFESGSNSSTNNTLSAAGCSGINSSQSILNCDQQQMQSSSKYVPAFNSISFGECEHIDTNQKNVDLQAESSFMTRKKKMNCYFDDLEKNYFDRCTKDLFKSKDSNSRLSEFKETLNKFTLYSKLRPLTSLNYAKDFVVHNIVSSIEFDKDAEFFAIAGVAKKIKIFDYSAVVKDSLGINYPINEIECTSKISCLSWNSYYKATMATSDYEGSVILWDAFLGQKLTIFQEHEKRCWSVDYNKIDINLVASGSDDAKVKLWSANMDSSITTLNSTANICSVKFNPKSLYHLAFGSADHRVYYYDLRNTKTPLMIFKEHRKAVSYVEFLNEHELVSASTDSQIKLWNTNQSSCLRSYKGHINEKNFVGLTANDDFIACGSENNSLYVYYKGIERQMLNFCFDKVVDKDENNDFVSAVCWRTGSNIIVAANSQGNIKILELV